jgi:hypothetical protein
MGFTALRIRSVKSWRVLRILPLVFVTASTPFIGACGDSTAPGGCCKVCRTGKACGDTCISKSDTCHKGAGCACDG